MVKAHVAHQRRRFTEDTRGGIIAITQYEIVAALVGDKRYPSVTLRVHDLQFRGSDGSATFGKPEPIQRRQKIYQLIQQLRVPKSAGSVIGSQRMRDAALEATTAVSLSGDDVTVDYGYNGEENHSAPATQAGFATQAPKSRDVRITLNKQSKPLKSPVASQKVGHTPPHRYTPSARANPKSRNTEEILLGLLKVSGNLQDVKPTTNRIPESRSVNGGPVRSSLSDPNQKYHDVSKHVDSAQQISSFSSGGHARQHPQPLVMIPALTSEELRHTANDRKGTTNDEPSNGQDRSHITSLDTRKNGEEDNSVDMRGKNASAEEIHEGHAQGSKKNKPGLVHENGFGEHEGDDPWRVCH